MWCFVAFWLDKSPIETAVKSVCFSSTPRFVYKTTFFLIYFLPIPTFKLSILKSRKISTKSAAPTKSTKLVSGAPQRLKKQKLQLIHLLFIH